MISSTTIKTLFALSGNVCGWNDPETQIGCEHALTDPSWEQVRAEICHIRGLRPTSTRYDPEMNDEERNGYENLILMCPNHHQLVDDLEPEKYSVDFLTEMKERATVRADAWRYDDEYLLTVTSYMESKLQYEEAALEAKSTPLLRVSGVSSAPGPMYATSTLSTSRQLTNTGLTAIKDISQIVLDMRNLFNVQQMEHQHDSMPWAPSYGSPETLARTDLIRRLEMSLAMLGFDAAALPNTNTLMTTHLWSSTLLEAAIKEIKDVLGEPA